MSELYNNFEKRFSTAWFSPNWGDVEVDTKVNAAAFIPDSHKDLETLEGELNQIKNNIESIIQKQLRLANLAKFYKTSAGEI